MNDLDPRIERALDLLAPGRSEAPGWSRLVAGADTNGYSNAGSRTLRLAHPPRVRRRRVVRLALVLVAAAIAITVLLATPALGLRGKIADLFGREVPTAPAVEEMSVFTRPRTQADVLPSPSWGRRDWGCDEDMIEAWGGCLGSPLGDDSRLLLAAPGSTNINLYAWPTENGGVCFAWSGGAGGCVVDFQYYARAYGRSPTFMGIDPDREGVGVPGALVGVVPDNVASAEVVVQGQRRPAIVESNGLFYELPDPSCTFWAFESLTVGYVDGTSETVPIDWRRGRKAGEGPCRV